MTHQEILNTFLTVGTAIGALLAGLFIFILPYRKMIKSSKLFSKEIDYPEDFNYNIHTRLHECLTELRVQCDCARTQIVQFHNGGEFVDGLSMKKMSLTHESLAAGTSSELEKKKDLPISLCVDALLLLKENTPTIYVVEHLEDSWCKKFMQVNNVISFSLLPLKKKNEITGYVMCQWCSWSKADCVDEKEIAPFIENARNVAEFTLEQQKRKSK
ncbi:hypothetical protein CMI47_22900 [Candidatus Pacearchaeota archaeon]|nr:hypothetical protein [Candidatus Pacearchaeota archaeon]|tara:strand:+ start:103 stop:747 length:645 start_codon:yes stop_codon:yes gene_type:complete